MGLSVRGFVGLRDGAFSRIAGLAALCEGLEESRMLGTVLPRVVPTEESEEAAWSPPANFRGCLGAVSTEWEYEVFS